MSVALLCVAGVALDALLGEPRRWHPLVAFGNFAGRIEQRFNSGGRGWRSHGVTAWFIAVVPLTLLATALSWAPYIGWVLEILALYCALGLRSLGEHVIPVAEALRRDDLDGARQRVSYLVSRQTSELDHTEVAAPPPSQCWKTAAMRCLPRCSGLSSPVCRGWCCTV